MKRVEKMPGWSAEEPGQNLHASAFTKRPLASRRLDRRRRNRAARRARKAGRS